MKILSRILIFSALAFVGFLIYFFYAFKDTTWGGWKPPSTEFKLDQAENQWKKQIERKYACQIDFIGLDSGFRQDSILYINLIYKTNSVLHRTLNDDIEAITDTISKSFLFVTKRKEQKYIWVSYEYEHHFSQDRVVRKIPLIRDCLFDIKHATIVPTEHFLIAVQYPFLVPNPEKKLMEYNLLGRHRYNYVENGKDFARDSINFNGVPACERYISKNETQIAFPSFTAHYSFIYIFKNELCISATINYTVIQESNNLPVEEIVDKLTRTKNYSSSHKNHDIYNEVNQKIKTNHYDCDTVTYGIRIKSSSRKFGKSWKISYETSLHDIEYYSNWVEK